MPSPARYLALEMSVLCPCRSHHNRSRLFVPGIFFPPIILLLIGGGHVFGFLYQTFPGLPRFLVQWELLLVQSTSLTAFEMSRFGQPFVAMGKKTHRPPCFPWRSFIVMKWALLCSKLEPKHALIGCLPLQGRCSCVPLPNQLSGHVVSVHLLKESLHMRQAHASHTTCSLVAWPVFHLPVSRIFPRVFSVEQEWIGFLVYHMLKQSFQEGL